MTTKINRAVGYFAAYIRTNGRFDLQDLADRAGVSDELAFVIEDVLKALEDEDYLLDIEEAYEESRQEKEAARPPISDWLKELTDRYFA